MDEKPFLEFDITKLKDSTIREIEKFHKSNFDVNQIIGNASVLKYTSELKHLIENELKNPSNEFVKHFASQIYSGRLTANVLEEFKDFTQKAFNQYISDRVNDRLNAAINKEQEKQKELEPKAEDVEDTKVVTTEEEIEGYNIVVAILRRKITKERIVYRDTQSYFGILLDDNNRKPITRLHLNGGVKYISLFDKDKKETKEKIESIDDIYNFEKQLLDVIDYYDGE